VATTDQIKAMVYQKAVAKGIGNLWPIIDGIITRESGWSPTAHNTQGEDSVGLFQMNRAGGLGSGYTVAQLLDPNTNAEAALNVIAQRAQAGESTASIFRDWTTAPAAIVGVGNMGTPYQGPSADVIAATGAPPTTPTTGTAAGKSFEDFLKGKGITGAYQDQTTGQTFYDPMTAFDQLPAAIQTSLWTEFNGGAGTVDTIEAGHLGVAQGTLAETVRQNNLAAVYKSLENLVNAGALDAQYAADEYTRATTEETAKQGRLGEARVRGEDVQKTLEERAALTTEGEYFPGYGPNDPLAQVMGKYGLNPSLVKGTPESQFPDPWETFRQANLSVGMPGTMEPLQFPSVPRPENPYRANQPMFEAAAGLGGAAAGGASVPPPYQGPTEPAESGLTPAQQQHLANMARVAMQRALVGRGPV